MKKQEYFEFEFGDANNYLIVDDILFIDQDDEDECFVKEKSNENESVTTSVSDNTFYDTDGASNYYSEKLKRQTREIQYIIPTVVRKFDEAHNLISDWASTGDDTSFYDDRSGALLSIVDRDFRSISSHKSSCGAY